MIRNPSRKSPARGTKRLSFFSVVQLLTFAVAYAAASAQTQTPNSEAVTLDGKAVIEIRWGNQSIRPEMRAGAISERLQRVADDPRVPASIKVVPLEDGLMIDIMAGDQHLASVFPGDAKASGVTTDALARNWAAAFERAIKQYRGHRSWTKRIESVVFTLLILAGTIFLFFAIRNATNRLAAATAAHFERRMDATSRKVVALVPRTHVRAATSVVFKGLRFILWLLVLAFAFQLLLLVYPDTRYIGSYLLDSVLASVYAFGAAAWNSAPSIAFLLVVAVTTWYLLKFLHFIFQQLANGTVTIEGFRPSWAGTTNRLLSILLVVLAVLIAYPYIPGSESPAFKGVSLFLGLLVSLGSTGLVANIVSGIMLTYMDQFQVGDIIRIGEFMARVKKTSMLTTQLHTRKNEIVTIPNSLILSQEVTNFSAPGEAGLVISSTVGIGYDVPWRQVESMMKLAAARTSGVSHSIEPFVYTLSLNQFDITYELNVHIEKDAMYWATKSELNQNVLDAFNEFGVQIMTPAYEGDPDGMKVVPRSRWFSAPAREGKASDRFRHAG